MKQFKKFLCGVMLTSFVIIGSVSVFAGPDDGGGDGSNVECEQKIITESISTEKAETYRQETNADMQFNEGHMWPEGAENPDPILYT